MMQWHKIHLFGTSLLPTQQQEPIKIVRSIDPAIFIDKDG